MNNSIDERTINLFEKSLELLKPPPNLGVDEWAEKHRVLTSISSKETGRWETSRTPYMVEVYQAVTRKEVRQITLMLGAQLSKSELMINTFGRYAHLDPCPMLLVQPTDTLAKEFSKERVEPAIENSVLKNLIKAPNKKNSGNTISHKMFPGGFLAFLGAQVPSKLAGKPIRNAFLDEVDRYPASAGVEGSPISLIKRRMSTFEDICKLLISGTPTIKGKSVIESEFGRSSQAEWYVPCPKCGKHQRYLWKNLKWEKGKPSSVKMICEHCEKLSTEKEWKRDSLQKGKWIHKFKERKEHLGYHLNALASPFKKWKSLVQEWEDIQGSPEELKTFINTVLAETWEEEIKGKMDYEYLSRRTKEKYNNKIPDRAYILTAGIDVQNDWLAIEVVAWGDDYESWGIKYKVLEGNLENKETWNKLEEFLDQEFYFKDGIPIKIFMSCIDTGGNHTQEVYNFVARMRAKGKTIIGIKGQGGDAIPVNNGFRETKNKEIDLLSVGVNALKDITYGRLAIKKGNEGYCHFNGDRNSGYDLDYFKSLTAEVKSYKGKRVEWTKIRDRNEGLDCRNYATIPFYISNIDPIDLANLTREQLSELSITGTLSKPVRKKSKVRSKGVEI